MKKKKRIVLGIIISIVLAVTAIVIGLSSTSALFVKKDTSKRVNNYNTGILSITAVSKSDTISLDNTLPMSDELGAATTPYIFTIKNNGNVDYQFDVQLLATSANTFDSQYIKLKIDNDEVTTLSALTNSKIKSQITLAAQQTMDISIRIWLASNTPNSQIGKSFTSQLVINGIAVSPTSNYGVSAASYITNLYNNATKTIVTNNNIDYNYATSVSLMNDRLGGTTKDLNAGNIRYYGANPNNYIDIGHRDTKPWKNISGLENMFETSQQCYQTIECSTNYAAIGQMIGQTFTNAAQCEAAMPTILSDIGVSSIDEICSEQPILYRIIGVFDNMLKVVAVDSIGNYSWDTSASGVNDGDGINEWTQADLMKLLNPGYENDSVNNSLYWNGGSGTCYNEDNNATTSCDFTDKVLTDTIKNKIATATWNLGAQSEIFNQDEGYVDTFYKSERGTVHIENPTDGITRQNTWTGKVGLIYPSDYGYAVNFSSCMQKLTDYNNNLCISNNWLLGGIYWTLTSSLDNLSHVWFLHPEGNLYNHLTRSSHEIHPVFYLNSEVSIASGTGTSADPYVLR